MLILRGSYIDFWFILTSPTERVAVNRVSQCMTSASELFHIRRHRLGRNDIDSSFHSSPSSDFHHHHRLHDSDDDDSPRIRRHYNVRRLRHHVPSYFPSFSCTYLRFKPYFFFIIFYCLLKLIIARFWLELFYHSTILDRTRRKV